jgi:hypothetical protein
LFKTAERYARDKKDNEDNYIRIVRFTNFDDETVDIFKEEFQRRYLKANHHSA